MSDSSLQQSSSENGIQTETMSRYDQEIQRRKFWGQVVLTYEDGKLVNLKETRNLKPDQLKRMLAKR